MPFARYRYRIEPNAKQREHLARLFGCVRLVWNQALEHSRSVMEAGGKTPSAQQLSKWLTSYKQSQGYLQDAPSTPLQESVLNLGAAWKRHHSNPSRTGAPQFHQKKGRQSARFTRRTFRLAGRGLVLQKIPGRIKVRWSRSLPQLPSSAVVMLDPDGRYSVSFTVEVTGATSCPLVIPASQAVGIDLGVASFASLSTGEQIQGPDHSRLHERIRRLQRRLDRSRTKPLSRRGEQLARRIARLHSKAAAQRTNALHQLSTDLVRRFDLIALEDLKTSALLRAARAGGRPGVRAAKAGLNRAIASMGWGQFKRLLQQKVERHGKRLVLINPGGTSLQCSRCGHSHALNRTSQASFLCRGCGHSDNADINAARNILAAGQAATGQGACISPPHGAAAGAELPTRRYQWSCIHKVDGTPPQARGGCQSVGF